MAVPRFTKSWQFAHYCVAPPRWRVDSYRRKSLSVLPCSDRGRHIPALTVMNGGRGVGFDMARSETPFCFAPATQLDFLKKKSSSGALSFIFLSLLSSPAFCDLSCLCAVDVASVKPTVAAAAKRSRASLEISLSMFCDSVPCVGSRASAGHFVVHFVTGQMVGDRRFPGATILGASFSNSSANDPASVPLTCSELRDALLRGQCTRRLPTRCCGSRHPPMSLRRHFALLLRQRQILCSLSTELSQIDSFDHGAREVQLTCHQPISCGTW